MHSLEPTIVASRPAAAQPTVSSEKSEGTSLVDFADVLADVGKEPRPTAVGADSTAKNEVVGTKGTRQPLASEKTSPLKVGEGKRDGVMSSRVAAEHAATTRKKAARLQPVTIAPVVTGPAAMPLVASTAAPIIGDKANKVSPPCPSPTRTAQLAASCAQDCPGAPIAPTVASNPPDPDLAVSPKVSDHDDPVDAAQVLPCGGDAENLSVPARMEDATATKGQSSARHAAQGGPQISEELAPETGSTMPTGVVRDEHGGLSVHLSLPHIGALKLKVTGSETGTASVNISAEREGTLRALISDQAQLHAILKEGGIQTEGRTIEFSLLPASSAGPDSWSGSGAHDQSRRHHSIGAEFDGESEPGGSGTGPGQHGQRHPVTDSRLFNLIDITA